MIEVLFVIIILGVVAAYAMPVMERGVASSKADRAAATIANELRNAFSLAARQRKPVRVVISPTRRTIALQDRTTGTELVRRDLSNERSPYGLTSLAASSTTLDIFPNGIASDTLAIRFSVSTNGRVVRMSRVGQIRLE